MTPEAWNAALASPSCSQACRAQRPDLATAEWCSEHEPLIRLCLACGHDPEDHTLTLLATDECIGAKLREPPCQCRRMEWAAW